jgi:cytochrome c553
LAKRIKNWSWIVASIRQSPQTWLIPVTLIPLGWFIWINYASSRRFICLQTIKNNSNQPIQRPHLHSMFHQLIRALVFGMAGLLPLQAAATPVVEDTMAQRTLACTACHGKQGRRGRMAITRVWQANRRLIFTTSCSISGMVSETTDS